MSLRKAVALIGIAGALVAIALASGREECIEGVPCDNVDSSINRVATVLYSKYGVDKREAFKIAEDLLSGDRVRAEAASKRIADVGAVKDVIKALE